MGNQQETLAGAFDRSFGYRILEVNQDFVSSTQLEPHLDFILYHPQTQTETTPLLSEFLASYRGK